MGFDSVMRLSMLFSAVDGLSGPVRKMVQSVQDLEGVGNRGKALTQLGDQVSWAGSRVTAASERMKSGMGMVLEPIMGVEDSLAELQTVWTPSMGTIEESLGRAKTAAIDWSNSHKASASEFVKTAYQMGSAGLKETEAIAGTKAALTLATASLGDNVEAANLLGLTYNTLGDKTAPAEKEMGRMADVLARTQQLYQISDLGQLNAGLQYAIPVTQSARVSFEQMNAAIGQLNSSGLQGSMAGTAYSSMLTRLADASGDLGFQLVRTADGGLDLEGTLRSIRNIYGPLSRQTDEVRGKFKDAFGDEGVRAVGLLTENLAGYQSGLLELNNSQGAAEKGAAAIEATSSSAWERMQNQIANAAMPLGDQLLPLLEDVMPVLTSIVKTVADFLAQNPELTKLAMTGFLIAQGVTSVLGPVMEVGGGLASMAGHGMRAYQWVGQKLVSAGPGLTKLGSAAVKGGRAFLGLASGVIKAGLAFMATPIGWIVAGITVVAGLAAWAIADWDGFKQFWVDLWDSVVGILKDAWGWIKDTVGEITEMVSDLTDILPGNDLAGAADEGARSMVNDYFGRLSGVEPPVPPVPGAAELQPAVGAERPVPDLLGRYKTAMPAPEPAPVGDVLSRYRAADPNALGRPGGDAVERFQAMGGDGASAEMVGLTDRLNRLRADLELPVGADYPELGDSQERGKGAEDRTDGPPAYRDPFLAIPDRRSDRDVKEGPTVNIASINVTSAKPVDEKRLVEQVMAQLMTQLRAEGAVP